MARTTEELENGYLAVYDDGEPVICDCGSPCFLELAKLDGAAPTALYCGDGCGELLDDYQATPDEAEPVEAVWEPDMRLRGVEVAELVLIIALGVGTLCAAYIVLFS